MYKVCILTAGKGTRNKYITTNKALLPIGDETALSYLVSKTPLEVEIIIAIGYNARAVISHALQWGDRVTFAYADYEGIGRGPGYSLLCCKYYLQCPFIFTSCDTIVLEDYPEPNKNWIGVHPVEDTEQYLTVKGGELYDKEKDSPSNLAFIGVAGVKDYKDFWEGLSKPILVNGEHQVTDGLRALRNIQEIPFTWFDTGNTEGYENADRYFSKSLS